MPKVSLNSKLSDWFVVVYITLTLAARFILEPQLNGQYLVSLGLGAFALLFLWALIKSKFIQPTYFGFFPTKEQD
ncbi:MAG: hypothetical protein R2795_24865 [Saprospiraceae bacterium]